MGVKIDSLAALYIRLIFFHDQGQQMDYYALLGVEDNANDATIRTAYRLLAIKYHPDKNIEDRTDAEIRFKLVLEAYETLSDPSKRTRHDATLRDIRRRRTTTSSTEYDVTIDEFGVSIHDMHIRTMASVNEFPELEAFESAFSQTFDVRSHISDL
tara:strand:+ start:1505 stop:1972 length:468 start_codon:yes stop_codon:yes gene_type:complete